MTPTQSVVNRHPPTARRLAVTTATALAVSAAVVVAVVMPAEYGVDPLGTGRMLGLTAMSQLTASTGTAVPLETDRLVPTADGPVAHYASGHKVDAVQLVLGPYEYVEYKYRLEAGASMMYAWSANAELIHDFHADAEGAPAPDPVSFDKRNRREANGLLTAPFAGIHGWYWENPGANEVTVSLVSAGFYSAAVEMRSNRRRQAHELTTPRAMPRDVPQ